MRSRAAVVILHLGFVIAGIVTTLLGPLLPVLIVRWSLNDRAAGLFFTLQFFGSIAGIASLGPLLSRKGYRLTFFLGFGFMSLGTATLLPLNNVAGMAATALSGYGLGLTLSAGNLWIGEVAAQRRTSALSILNLAWGLGAVSSAPLVMFAQLAQQPLTLLASIAALSGLIAVTLAAMAIQPIARNRLETRLEKDIPIKPVLPALGTFFFLYVGIETCVGGWAATLARRMATSSGELWTLAPMLFWAGLLTGRALTPVLLREMSEQALLIGGMTMGMLGTLALLLSQAFLSALICVAITGFGLASIYPILVSWMVGHYGSQARQTGSVMFVMGSLGGATLPWLVGFTSMRTNSLTTGLWIPLVGCLLMISLASFSPISASER